MTPAPVITAPVLQIVLGGRMAAGGGNSTPCGNVFYYRMITGGGIINKTNVATIFRTTIIVPLLAAANIRYTPTKVTIRNIQDATDLPVDVNQAGVGAVATDSEPSNDAVVVVLKSSFRGKNGRGFKHFGGTNESDTTQDILTGGGLALWAAVAAACALPMTDAGGVLYNPFIFSPFQSQIKTNPTVVRGYDVASVVLDKDVRTMRKRKTKPAIH